MNFGGGGAPNSWGSKGAFVLIMVGCVALCAAIGFLGHTIKRMPKQLLSLPHRDYWLRPENLPGFYRRLDNYLAECGVAMLLFFFWVILLCLMAHDQDPVRLNETSLFIGLGALLLWCVYYCIKPFWIFRPPKTVADDSEGDV